MNKNSIISGVIYLFMILNQSGVYAQSQLNIIGRITAEDGLITEGVKYIMKDSEGFMWFTYASGFNRWDGYDAKNFPDYLEDTNLNSSYRYCRPIVEDKNGNFFIGTLKNGLLKLDRRTDLYIHYMHDPDDSTSIGGDGIHDMICDESGVIWLGTFVEGLSRFDPVTETFRNYRIIAGHDYHVCNNIRSIYKDSQGLFWVGTSNGLFQFDMINETFIPIENKPKMPEYLNSFECMVEDRNGNMWFGSRWGIFNYIRETGEWTHFETNNPDKKESDADEYVLCLAEYDNGLIHQLWIGTQAGLKAYDIKSGVLTHFTPKNGYPEITNAGPVQYLYIDDHDILWASLGGITLIDLKKNPFDIYELKSFPDSLYDTPATCFYEDSNGFLWIGTQRDGLYQFDDQLNFIANYKPCKWDPKNSGTEYNNYVSQIYEDNNNRLWVCTGPSGICIFDRDSGAFKIMDIDVGSYIPHEIIMDSFGIIWIAAHDGIFQGVMSGEDELKIWLYDNPTLPKVPIDNMLSDTHNRLWIITRASGVFCLTPENRDSMVFMRYFHAGYHQRFTIEYNARSMIEDDSGNIWFRSEKELFKYDPTRDSIVPDDYFNNNFQNNIYSFTRDKNGIFWFASETGLLQYDPSDTITAGIRIIDKSNGLLFTDIERNIFFRDRNGYLLQGGSMSTFRGFFRFNPDDISGPDKTIPPVVLTSFSVKNQPFKLENNINCTDQIELSHNLNFFSFEFSALSYFDPKKNHYAYMLEGFDEDWVLCGNRRFVNYTGVPAGDYMFRVKGSNSDGYWNEKGAQVAITILKPPWKSWWAGTLYGILITGILISIIWYYLKRQQLRHALEIEHLQKEQLAGLDKLKSRFFANISHEFRTPLTLILGPIEKLKSRTPNGDCMEDLNVMQRNAVRLQRLIDQLLSLSKIEAGQMKLNASQENLVAFVNGYFQSFESAARQKGIELILKADKPDLPVFIDLDKMEKVLYNLLSNALKFTPQGGRIVVSVGQKINDNKEKLSNRPIAQPFNLLDKCVVISITDTGCGISPEHLPHIFDRFYQADDSDSYFQEGTGIGLALVKELVELHNGKINVESLPGTGTTFRIELLQGKDHLQPEEILPEAEKPAVTGEGPIPVVEGIGIDTAVRSPNIYKSAAGKIKKPLLLLVEDNADMLYYIRSSMKTGYQLVEAANGQEGMEEAINRVPDLVISDVMMPVMDGYELCRKLKADERTSHIPVILLTAKAAMEDKLEGLGTGADDFLTKPFQPAELLVRAGNLIRQRQLLREKYRKEFEDISLVPEQGMTSVDTRFMEKARQVVSRNLINPEFNITVFSSEMHMSRVQLHRKLSGLFNLSATEFIRTSRLNAAARLLEEKAGNVAQIAYEVGFNNLSYFSKCFQKQFGVKPSEYLMGNHK